MNKASAVAAFEGALKKLRGDDNIAKAVAMDETVVVIADGKAGQELGEAVDNMMNNFDAAERAR
jgi:hypothetical protein